MATEYFTNGTLAQGDTGWTLPSGYSVVLGEYLLWDSAVDIGTSVFASKNVTVPVGQLLQFSFDFWCEMDDLTIVTAGTSSSALNNSRILVRDAANNTLATVYTGDTRGAWKKRSFLFFSPVSQLKMQFMGRRAGETRWRNISVQAVQPTVQVAPTLGLGFKGGNWGNVLSSTGGDISDRWLASGSYTAANKAAWTSAFNNMYIANDLEVCRIFLYIGGNYDTNTHLLNSTWSALKSTESTNLADFMANVIPDGVKVIISIDNFETYADDVPNSVLNPALAASPAHETQDNYFARVGEVLDILVPYKSKIAFWEIMNEPNLRVSSSVTWDNIRDFCARFYTLVKTKDTTVPVIVSYQNPVAYMYHDTLVEDTADVIGFHYYGERPWESTSNGNLSVIPSAMELPCIMEEGRHIDGASNPGINAPYVREANNLYYLLGYEGYYPWTIQGVGGVDGSSALDLDWVPADALASITPEVPATVGSNIKYFLSTRNDYYGTFYGPRRKRRRKWPWAR